MKLASFIVLSAALHGVALVFPISFYSLDGEPFTQVILVTLEEAGGAPSKGGVVGNEVRGSMPRAQTTQITSDQQIDELAKIHTPSAAIPAAEVSVTVSEGLSAVKSSDSISFGAAALAPGAGGGSGNGAGGTGDSETGAGMGSGSGIAKGAGQYTRARTSDAPKPKYPDTARRDGKEGQVLLRVLVNEEGRSASVEVNRSSGVEVLDQAALEAIKRWRFAPARLGDRPVESWVRIPIDFRLNDTQE
jgi:protein TonB